MKAIQSFCHALTLILVTTAASGALAEQQWHIAGLWDLYTDGELDTTLHIHPAGSPDTLDGRVMILHRPQDQGAKCNNCSGAKKDQPILNMAVVEGLKWNAGKKAWYGQVTDPNDGQTADIRLRLNDQGDLDMCAFFKTDYICLARETWKASSSQP